MFYEINLWWKFKTSSLMLIYAMQLHSLPKQPRLKLKTLPKQLLRSLPLAFALPAALTATCMHPFSA
jgi:hypothetical protein